MSFEANAVFTLNPKLPEPATQEAICARLRQLRALATVMEGQDSYIHPPTILQGYAWTLVQLIDETNDLFFALWEREPD